MFETVNKAYEFLCSKVSKTTEGPDPDNIILILKTQTILYTRHNEGVGEGRGGEGGPGGDDASSTFSCVSDMQC